MKLMPLRFAGHCVACGVRIEARTKAWYDPTAKTVTCTSCRPEHTLIEPSPHPPPTQPPPMRSARSDKQLGTELEQQIAALFTGAGYHVETNVIREGRSGGSHEVDVLATRTDELLALTVAVECKAWANPIEKDVVANVDFVRRDLGLGHALIVSLNGARAGAIAAAHELGVALWGPDELEPRLGRASIEGLQHRPMVQEVAFPRRLDIETATGLIEKETSGRLGIGRETVLWSVDAWLPVSVVHLTLMRNEGVIRKHRRTTDAWNVYCRLSGTFIARFSEEPADNPVELDAGALTPKQKAVDASRAVDAAVAKYRKVTSEAAVARARRHMIDLGIPDTFTAASVTAKEFLYPVHLAISEQRGTERVLAIDGHNSRLDVELGHALSSHITTIRQTLAPTATTESTD